MLIITRKDFGAFAAGKSPPGYIFPIHSDINNAAKTNCDGIAKVLSIQMKPPKGAHFLSWGQTIFPNETTELLDAKISAKIDKGIRPDDDVIVRLLACVVYADAVTNKIYETSANYMILQTSGTTLPLVNINMGRLPTTNGWKLVTDILNAGFTAEYRDQ